MAGASHSVSPRDIALRILGRAVRVSFHDHKVSHCLEALFGGMEETLGASEELHYVLAGADDEYQLSCGSRWISQGALEDVLFDFEKDIILEAQRRRPELLYLHAAVVSRNGRAWLIAADSGSGKSTLTWALLHRGFGYLSDELAPVDLRALTVVPYSHAVCLKRRPPLDPLPAQSVDLGGKLHVPIQYLPGVTERAPLSIGGIFVLSRYLGDEIPRMRRISPAEAAAHLYCTTLNALAHPERGLDAVLLLSQAVPCFALDPGNLAKSCEAVHVAIDEAQGAKGAGCCHFDVTRIPGAGEKTTV